MQSQTNTIRLVAIDLDGTLLNSDKQITDTTAAILKQARAEQGVRVLLASARPPRSTLPFHRLLDLDTPMINYNGALVLDPADESIWLHRPVPGDATAEIASVARKLYPGVLVSGEKLDRWYTDRFDDEFDAPWKTETARLFRPDVVSPLDDWIAQDLTKLLLLSEPRELSRLVTVIRDLFGQQVSVVQTEGELIQIMHVKASKSRALRMVAGRLGIDRSQVMAIGDNANDVGMLRWARVGVAVGNAVPVAREAADYVTDTNDADGAAKAIHEPILRGTPPRRS